jgi:hypothetical protein
MVEDYTRTYIHKMIITRLLYQFLKKEKVWKGFLAKGSSNNHEVNIRFTLAELLNEPIETIDLYLCYSEYLTDYALIVLEVSGKEEAFFKEAQKVKRNIVKELRHEARSDHYIKDCVSREVLKMAVEWDKKGHIRKWHERESIGACELNGNRPEGTFSFERQTVKLKKRADTTDVHKGCTPIKIKEGLIGIGRRLKNIPAHTGQGLEESADEVRAHIERLSQLYQKMRFLASQRMVQNRRKEAA